MEASWERPNLKEVELAIQVEFRDKSLLRQSFVHRSYLNEALSCQLPSNERLEFLGDAVLGFLVAELLYKELETAAEGKLTQVRAALVRTETLARIGQALGLGHCILMGRGEEASGGRKRPILLASTFEALVAAVYLDQGLSETRSLVNRLLRPELDRVLTQNTAKDAKSRLQELTQGSWQATPAYETVQVEGPDHARLFTVAVRVGDRILGSGKGRSKQTAEQVAARNALDLLKGGVAGGG